jgi:hypothetical protein
MGTCLSVRWWCIVTNTNTYPTTDNCYLLSLPGRVLWPLWPKKLWPQPGKTLTLTIGIGFGQVRVWVALEYPQGYPCQSLNTTDQSVYCQQQSILLLSQISQQITLIGSQVLTDPTSLLPYPTLHPSPSDCCVNVYWLISLICSLSAALLAMFVQQWVRAYMHLYQ